MGANMGHRLKTQGFPVTAVYDAYREGAEKLAPEIGVKPCDTFTAIFRYRAPTPWRRAV